jgi:hypothetical protein
MRTLKDLNKGSVTELRRNPDMYAFISIISLTSVTDQGRFEID